MKTNFLDRSKYFLDPFPNIPNAFQARVEENMKEEQKTREMQYYFDYNMRKAAVEMKMNNVLDRYIFDYDSNQIHKVSCKRHVMFCHL